MTDLTDDEWRVEVELDEDQHGTSLGERLRTLDLDDQARKRLGGSVIVTRSTSARSAATSSGYARETLTFTLCPSGVVYARVGPEALAAVATGPSRMVSCRCAWSGAAAAGRGRSPGTSRSRAAAGSGIDSTAATVAAAATQLRRPKKTTVRPA